MDELNLLRRLTEIPGLSGDEARVKNFIVEYVRENEKNWRAQPLILEGDDFQDCLMLVFGQPKVAAFAHMDTVGFCTRYASQLISVGQPDAEEGALLIGEDDLGPIRTQVVLDKEARAYHDFHRGIEPNTFLHYAPHWQLDKEGVLESIYLDNRLGVYNLLRLAETLEHGVLVFSTYEEHGGGSVPFLVKTLYEQLGVRKALISDITWVTDGVHHGKGVAISLRDRNIPRKSFVRSILQLADASGIPYQKEVEAAGSSDGREVHMSPYPMDWCFVGAPITGAHTPREKVQVADISSMLALYQYLFHHL
jgi:putative aminopeptidase FrvX